MNLITRIWLRLLREWWAITVPLRLRLKGVIVGERCVFYGMPLVTMAPGSRIQFAKGVTVCSDSRFTALGVSHSAIFRTLRPGAEIVIRENSGISGGSFCAAISITIGQECLIGADVVIADTDFHAINPRNRRYNNSAADVNSRPVVLEDNVFIGTGTFVLKGVNIGSDCVVGAGSVVTKDIPEKTIAAGNPARPIKALSEISSNQLPCSS